MSTKPMLEVGTYDATPFHQPANAHGKWTDWPELHDQKIVKKSGVYMLRQSVPVPEGVKPFLVAETHPLDGGPVYYTDEPDKARKFKGAYLLRTMWEWELLHTAVES